MTPSGKNINLAIVYWGPPDERKDFYKGLSRQGVKLTVAVNAGMGSYSSDGTYNVVPVDFMHKRHVNLGFSWGQLIHMLKVSRPDIIHVFHEYHCALVTQTILIRNIFLRRNIPIVCYNFQNIDYGNRKGGLKAKVVNLMARYNLRHIHGLTSANQQGLDIAVGYNRKLRVKKIFWPVDANSFFRKDQAACRQKINLPLDKKIIGYVGRFVNEKGLEDLLKAMGKVEAAVLLLIGEGEDQPRLKRIAAEMGLTQRVIFKPAIAAQGLVDYYNAFDCFVLPSRTTLLWKEQYGRVLVEAMMCGCRIVASSSGAIQEVLVDYPNKIIFSEGDIEAFTKAIEMIIEKEERDPGAIFLNRFSDENFLIEHCKFYQNILG